MSSSDVALLICGVLPIGIMSGGPSSTSSNGMLVAGRLLGFTAGAPPRGMRSGVASPTSSTAMLSEERFERGAAPALPRPNGSASANAAWAIAISGTRWRCWGSGVSRWPAPARGAGGSTSSGERDALAISIGGGRVSGLTRGGSVVGWSSTSMSPWRRSPSSLCDAAAG